MQFRYGLDARPPFWLMLAYGLQWLAVSIPFTIILGKAAAGLLWPAVPELQVAYLQKTFLVIGVFQFVQVFWLGHRLPLLAGPASVLLVGIAANAGADAGAIASSSAAGGLLLVMLNVSRLSDRVGRLFTQRIIGIVLLLIAFTMLPTIMRLVSTEAPSPFFNLLFAFMLLSAMLLGQRLLPGGVKSMLVLLSLIVGSLLYYLFTDSWPQPSGETMFAVWRPEIPVWSVDAYAMLSVLFCYFALWANDVGSIQSTAALVQAARSAERLQAGVAVTGAGNLLAGLLGVIGPVNYSLSAGLISASKCASRYTLLLPALSMIAMAFMPGAIQYCAAIPTVVIGSLLLYVMGSQLAAGLAVLQAGFTAYRLEDGLIIGLPLLLATFIAFLPAETLQSMPATLRPLLANGFVIGLVVAMLLEHVIFPQKQDS